MNKMVKISESKDGQKKITLRSGLCEAMGLCKGDEVAISFRSDLGLWVFHKVLK